MAVGHYILHDLKGPGSTEVTSFKGLWSMVGQFKTYHFKLGMEVERWKRVFLWIDQNVISFVEVKNGSENRNNYCHFTGTEWYVCFFILSRKYFLEALWECLQGHHHDKSSAIMQAINLMSRTVAC